MTTLLAKKSALSSEMILDGATERLLRAAKKKIVHEKGSVNYAQLAKKGYSSKVIARLKEI